MWVVKEKDEGLGREVYRKKWRLSNKTKLAIWEFLCYLIIAIMIAIPMGLL